MEETLTVFLFLEVRSRKSGQVVKLLSEAYGEIEEAAAVYSETDVIARLTGTKARLGEILLELMQEEIPVHDKEHNFSETFAVDSIRPFLVEGTVAWAQDNHSTGLEKDICAYVIVEVDQRQSPTATVLEKLRKRDGVIYTANLAKRSRVIAKLKAATKREFDDRIMDQIQSIPGVATTRSLLVINDMHFVRFPHTIRIPAV